MLVPYTILFLSAALVFVLALILPAAFRSGLLLLVSYALYFLSGTKNWYILPLICLIVWADGLLMERMKSETARRVVYLSGLFLVLLLFFSFKFASYVPPVAGKLVAPLGLSFFALEAYSYLSDCFHGRIRAERMPLYCFLYLSFFPTVTAGPIERAGNLIPQFKELDAMPRRRLIDMDRIADALILIIYGMFVKLVIADRLAILVDHIYSEYYHYGTVPLFIGMIGFGIQLYCDFMGYSFLASGLAQLFGIRIIDNFRAPYLTCSVTDFWRKWHVSLSSWLRDYVYIPLGGNRKGKARKCLNLMATFAVSGIWHGTGLHYLVWGLLHGAGCVVSNATLKRTKQKLPVGRKLLRALWTFLVVDLFWIFFRADSLRTACTYILRLFTRPDLWLLSDPANFLTYGLDLKEMCILLIALLVLFAVDLVDDLTGLRLDAWLAGQGKHFRVVFVLLLLFAVILYGEYGAASNPGAFFYASF